MNQHTVKILEANFINHTVKRFVVEKPQGYTFIPGQATDISVNLAGWQDKLRPFTFTGLPKWNYLEFMIKIYPEHNGVTRQLGKTNKGAELILHDVFGAIQYKGKGVFIAGGAGITPFISILRDLHKTKHIDGHLLINSNHTSADVIMGEELQSMLKDSFLNVYTRENVIGFLDRRIDRDFLVEVIQDFSQYFYVCGPDKFVKDISNILVELGTPTDTLVVEH